MDSFLCSTRWFISPKPDSFCPHLSALSWSHISQLRPCLHPSSSDPHLASNLQSQGLFSHPTLTLHFPCSQPSLVPCRPRIKSQPLSPSAPRRLVLLASVPPQPPVLCSCLPTSLLQLSSSSGGPALPPLVSGFCLLQTVALLFFLWALGGQGRGRSWRGKVCVLFSCVSVCLASFSGGFLLGSSLGLQHSLGVRELMDRCCECQR